MDDQPDISEVKMLIKCVIGSSATRMNLLDLTVQFRQLNGYALPYQQFGYRNAFDFLHSIPDTVRIVGHGPRADIFRVLNEKSAHMNMIQKQRKPLHSNSRPKNSAIMIPDVLNDPLAPSRKSLAETSPILYDGKVFTYFVKSTLEEPVKMCADYYPTKVMRAQHYPYNSDNVSITIGAIHDVADFWFTLKQNHDQLAALHFEMREFYNENKDQHQVPKSDLKRGLYCVIYNNNCYERGCIESFDLDNAVGIKVFCFDRGTIVKTELQNVFYLCQKFSDIPKQALWGRLAGINPATPLIKWRRDSSLRFLQMVKQKVLYARRSSTYDMVGGIAYSLYLHDPISGLSIDKVLVDEHFAVPV